MSNSTNNAININSNIEETTQFTPETCYFCGQVIECEEDVFYRDESGHAYCEACVYTCERCGCIVPADEAIHANSSLRWLPTVTLCPDCADNTAHLCRECDEWFTDDGIWDYYDGEPVCHTCEANDNYVRCATCGTIMLRDDAYYDEDRDDYYCGTHYHPRTTHLHGYSHLQVSSGDSSRFLRMPDERGVKLHYGIELEIDKGDDRDAVVDALYEHSDRERLFMCKTDGSLDNGVEIVSNPMSFRFAMEEFPFAEISEAARSEGFTSHDARTCGLHIHVSRVGLGESEYEQDLTTAKLMLLFDRFWLKLVKFSRRGSYELERWSQQSGVFYPGIEENKDEDIVKMAKEKVWNAGRYQAINIQNRHTVEFRLFRGTLNVDTIRATIQLIQTAVDFAKHTPLRDIVTVNWQDFVRSDYEELNAYLERRGLLEGVTVQDGGDNEDGNE